MQSDMMVLSKASVVCAICLEFPKSTIECVCCCSLFCLECVYQWFDKSRSYSCPLKCQFGSLRQVQGALKIILNSMSPDESMMDIVKEQTNWKEVLKNRDKMWVGLVQNWLISASKSVKITRN